MSKRAVAQFFKNQPRQRRRSTPGAGVVKRRIKEHDRRTLVAEEMGWICHYCRCRLTETTATFDHIVPNSRGGHGVPANGVLACRRCQDTKKDAMPTCRCPKCTAAIKLWKAQTRIYPALFGGAS